MEENGRFVGTAIFETKSTRIDENRLLILFILPLIALVSRITAARLPRMIELSRETKRPIRFWFGVSKPTVPAKRPILKER